jgi:hypothetical protein
MSNQARGLQNFISDLRNAKSKVRNNNNRHEDDGGNEREIQDFFGQCQTDGMGDDDDDSTLFSPAFIFFHVVHVYIHYFIFRWTF